MFKLTSYPPSECLRPYVQRYIVTEGTVPAGQRLDHLLIPGWTEIVYFNLTDNCQTFTGYDGTSRLKYGLFSGQLTRSFVGSFTGKVKIVGAHLFTPALQQLFPMPTREATNKAVHLEDIIGTQAIDFCGRLREQKSMAKVIALIETFLCQRLANARRAPSSLLLNSLDALPGNIRRPTLIRWLAENNNVSVRTLQKVFLNETGLTPKEYSQMYRFHAVVQMINNDRFNWKKAVEQLGFYDQAHLLNNFKKVTGCYPNHYLPQHATINRFITDHNA